MSKKRKEMSVIMTIIKSDSCHFMSILRKEMSVIMTIIKSDSGHFMSIQEICNDAELFRFIKTILIAEQP